MNYFVSRGGQQYGPYAGADLQRYLEQGHIRYSDLARTETMSEWLPLSQLLASGQSLPLNRAMPANPLAYGAAKGLGPIPPALHWALVLALSVITGIFQYIWMFVQAAFVRKIDPRSNALLMYALGFVASVVAGVIAILFVVMAHGWENRAHGDLALQPGLWIAIGLASCAGTALTITGFFSIRASMLRYYNSTEPIGLRMSGVMTFFFNILYFQYHFSRIAKWKETGILTPQG